MNETGWIPPDERTGEQRLLAGGFLEQCRAFGDVGEFVDDIPDRLIFAEEEQEHLGHLIPRVWQVTGSCLPGNAQVRMADGTEKEISAVRERDFVLTGNGTCQMVTRTWERPTTEKMLHFKVRASADGLKCTESHVLPVLRPGKKFFWLKAKHVKVGDKLLFSSGMTTQTTQLIDVLDYVQTAFKVTAENIQRHYSQAEKAVKSHALAGILDKQLVSVKKGRAKNCVNRYINVDEDFGRLVGMYIAEGSTDKHKVVFTFTHRIGLVDECAEIGKRIFGITPAIRHIEKQCVSKVEFHGTVVAEFMKKLVPGIATTKRVPGFFQNAPNAARRGLLGAWFDGDGYLQYRQQKGKSPAWRCIGMTSSKGLARDLALLARSIGIACSTRWRKPHKQSKASYEFNVRQGDFHKLKTKRWDVIPPSSTTKISTAWKTVEFVEMRDVDELVYDIEVKNEHTFVANGIVVHNCVGAGAAQAYARAMLGDVIFRGDQEEVKLPYPYATYGVGRAIAGMRRTGSGSFGAAQAKACQPSNFGMLAYDDPRVPQPSFRDGWAKWTQRDELTWSHPSAWPIRQDELHQDAREFGVHTVTKVASTEQWMQLLAQGYGVTLASMFGTRPRVEGDVLIGPWNGSWAHQMCLDQETEILARRGWINVSDIEDDDELATLRDDHHIEYQFPTHIHRYRYSGDMHHYKTEAIDLMVTPNHRVYSANKKSKKWTLTESKDITSTRRMMLSGSNGVVGHRLNPQKYAVSQNIELEMDDYLAFLGFWLAEGSVYVRQLEQSYKFAGSAVVAMRTNGYVSLTQKKPENVHWVDKLMEKLGPGWKRMEHTRKDGTIQWRNYKKVWRDMFTDLGNQHVRFVPDFVFHLGREQQKIVLDAMWKGDGCESRNCYYTVSKRLADGVQHLLVNQGYSSRIRKQKNNNGKTIYAVTRRTGRFFNGHHHGDGKTVWNREVVPYNGMVYCVTVPNEKVLVRRNNKCVWTGNSSSSYWKHPEHGLIFAIDNQWGPSAHPSCPTLAPLGVRGSFWITEATAARIIRTGEVFGHSSTGGFPARKFTWKLARYA